MMMGKQEMDKFNSHNSEVVENELKSNIFIPTPKLLEINYMGDWQALEKAAVMEDYELNESIDEVDEDNKKDKNGDDKIEGVGSIVSGDSKESTNCPIKKVVSTTEMVDKNKDTGIESQTVGMIGSSTETGRNGNGDSDSSKLNDGNQESNCDNIMRKEIRLNSFQQWVVDMLVCLGSDQDLSTCKRLIPLFDVSV